MKLFFRIIGAILFVIFFGFALKNTQEVALHFFWEYELRGPLVLLLLGFFIVGAAFGVLAMVPMVFRNRRELSKTRKIIISMKKDYDAEKIAVSQPPQPDSVVN